MVKTFVYYKTNIDFELIHVIIASVHAPKHNSQIRFFHLVHLVHLVQSGVFTM